VILQTTRRTRTAFAGRTARDSQLI
jgi:hypothetical protein